MTTTAARDAAPREARFWDRLADKYARQPVADEATYQEKLRRTRGYLSPGSRVLEVGCGTGSTAIAHAPHAGHILAVDVSGRMLEIARGKAEAAGARNVEFRQGAVEALDLPDASFDMVMAHSLLHLVRDRAAVIAGLVRLLKPGGVLVTSTACLGDRLPWMAPILPIGRALGVFPYVAVFSAAGLEAEFRSQGLEIVETYRPAKAVAAFMVARKPA